MKELHTILDGCRWVARAVRVDGMTMIVCTAGGVSFCCTVEAGRFSYNCDPEPRVELRRLCMAAWYGVKGGTLDVEDKDGPVVQPTKPTIKFRAIKGGAA